MASVQPDLERLMDDPQYLRLVRRRGRTSWILTSVMLVAYFGFILLVAFGRTLLSQPIAGGTTTLGIPLGLGVILVAIALTGLYVHRANSEFDREVEALVRKVQP